MKTDRARQISLAIKEEISKIILIDLPEDDLKFISITDVKLSKDLRHARVSFSSFASNLGEKEKEKITKLIFRYRGLIKKELGTRLNLRHTPDIKFFYDDSYEYAQRISKIIDEIKES